MLLSAPEYSMLVVVAGDQVCFFGANGLMWSRPIQEIVGDQRHLGEVAEKVREVRRDGRRILGEAWFERAGTWRRFSVDIVDRTVKVEG
jgi:hypothetical protein